MRLPYLNLKYVTLLAATITAGHVYDVKTSPSNFEVATQKMGFNQEKQNALLKIFTMSGYFDKQTAWKDMYRSKIFPENTQSIFMSKVYPIINASGADQKNPNNVDINLLREGLFARSKEYFWKKKDVTTQQVQDWILYVAQNAFDRKAGQERSELNSYNWMTKYKVEYFGTAKILGLIDSIDPTRTEYNEGWIAGASRPGIVPRVLHYKWLLEHGITVKGDSKVLAGTRPIWAEIDGMDPEVLKQLTQAVSSGIKIDDIKVIVSAKGNEERVKEGIEYIKYLAAKLNIPLHSDAPVIKYESKSDCPVGLFPGRTYPNYIDPKGPKLDETKMTQDVIASILDMNKIHIIDTQSQNNQRPNTETTARDTINILINDIKAGKYGDQKEFYILFVSNNPYIERQTLGAQKVINNALKESGLSKLGYAIKLEGVGFGCKQDIPTVHSEFGALIATTWQAIEGNELRSSTHLMFQTRDNTEYVPHLGVVKADDVD